MRNRSYRSFWISKNIDLINYQSLRVRFNELVSDGYARYISKTESDLLLNPGNFWKFINSKRKVRGFPSQISYEGTVGIDSVSISKLFAKFFKTSYVASDRIDNNYDTGGVESFDYLSSIGFVISSDDVYKSILKCDVKYSCGPDGIPSVVLKECVGLSKPLSILFNKSLSSGLFLTLEKVIYYSLLQKGW